MSCLPQICKDIGVTVSQVWFGRVSLDTKKLIIRAMGVEGAKEDEIAYQTNLSLPFIRSELKNIRRKRPIYHKPIGFQIKDNKLKDFRCFERVKNNITGEIKYVQKEKD